LVHFFFCAECRELSLVALLVFLKESPLRRQAPEANQGQQISFSVVSWAELQAA
jgi:hypothetical protein